MTLQKLFRRSLNALLSAGATLCIGFLSSAGMFVISQSMLLGVLVFILAIAYEGQVNSEGISGALKRMLGQDYLKRGVARRYLIKQFKTNPDNAFLNGYMAQRAELKRLSKMSGLTLIDKAYQANIKTDLKRKELFFLKQLVPVVGGYVTPMETAARALLDAEAKQKIEREIRWKKWVIRIGWLFAIGGGVSSGLAAFSAINESLVVFAFISFVPVTAWLVLAGFAAVGYTLLLYQAISDVVQDYQGDWWRVLLRRREDELPFAYRLRIATVIFGILISLFCAVATAGTWWGSAKNGADLLKMSDAIASYIRNISVILMAVPTFIFNMSNSIGTAEDVNKKLREKGILARLLEIYEACANIWDKEKFFQFINPFRLVEAIISHTIIGIAFMGHMFSIGVIANRLAGISAWLSTFLNGIGEAFMDWNYLKRNENLILKTVLLPITLTTFILRALAVAWDYPFNNSLQDSIDKFFPSVVEPITTKPVLVEIVDTSWETQVLIEVCDEVISHCHHAYGSTSVVQEKMQAARNIKGKIKDQVINGNINLDSDDIKLFETSLNKNRFGVWQQETTFTKSQWDAAKQNYKTHSGPNYGN